MVPLPLPESNGPEAALAISTRSITTQVLDSRHGI